MLLEVKNLTKIFGKLRAVDRISFTVKSGWVCGFVGPNGAGKTTTMRIISSLDQPTNGDVFINGFSVIEYPEKTRRFFGFMPDNFAKYANLTVEEYLDFFAAAYGLRGKEKRRRIETIFDFMDLEDLRGRLSNKLSKGMSQRLGLAKALIHDPELLILDEPAAGLDPRTRVQVRELLKVLSEQGKGILVSSHILTELSEICDYVTIIEQGKIRASGNVSEIMKKLKPHVTLNIKFQKCPHDPVLFLLEQPNVLDASAICNSANHSNNANQKDPSNPHVNTNSSNPSNHSNPPNQPDPSNSPSTTVTITFSGNESDQAELLKKLVSSAFSVSEFRVTEQGLEDLFLSLTAGKVQ